MKKFAGVIIILQMCTKNHNHMMYISWDKKWDRQDFLSFWAIFYHFTPHLPTTTPPPHANDPKNKKWKKCLELLSFYTQMCTINEHHMIYGF